MYNLKLYLHVNVPNPSVIVLCCQHMRKLREQLNKLQYHFRVTVSGRGEIHTWISDLNPSSFDFTKKKKGEHRHDTDRNKWYPSQNNFVFPGNQRFQMILFFSNIKNSYLQ